MPPMHFSTPMMQQYSALKAENPDALLLFRCGDFYETYAEDAEEAGRLLNITVTRKGAGADGEVAMAGVPYHAIESYLAKLVRLGKRVAMAEQMENPKEAKGLVKRQIVRVISPGTALEESMLEDRANNYLVCLSPGDRGVWGVSIADVSTGFFALTQVNAEAAQEELLTELTRLEAKEILLPDSADAALLNPLFAEQSIAVTRLPDTDFSHQRARALLLEHFAVQSLEGFGAEELTVGTQAAGALLQYLRDTQKSTVGHLRNLTVKLQQSGMILDSVTQRSLELVRNIHGGTREGTLLQLLDRTVTPMGARMLRSWVLNPLREEARISARLDSVEEFVRSLSVRTPVFEALKGIRDLERIVSRVCIGNASPRDLGALRDSLLKLPALKRHLLGLSTPLLRQLGEKLDCSSALANRLAGALVEFPPVRVSDGGIFALGYNAQLDEIRMLATSGKDWIASFRAREAERIGMDKLKVGYNKVFGYYIEFTTAQLKQLPGEQPPSDYIRKQTLANCERYITQELKEKEDLILNAEDRLLEFERGLFNELRDAVAAESAVILADAELLAQVDCLRSLADVALSGGYVRPELSPEGELQILDGRHPVLEALQKEPPFVANDSILGGTKRIALITGPNMAGKSTFIRQVALITLLAHMGSFVPASRATVPLVDRIFTRVGAMDHLARGQSTFLVEMTETANILRHATSQSLVILDEIGRGTSTYDGLSIAWAVVEYLHNTPNRKPLTFFATHYHELTQLEGLLPLLQNLHVSVLELKERITFLYKILPGATDRSYGVHAAQYAGVPERVVSRAREILGLLEKGEHVAPQVAGDAGDELAERSVRGGKKASILPKAEPWEHKQLSLFDSALPSPVEERLEQLDPNRLTPIQALAVLMELKQMLEKP
ncbi:MAG: DNA mismatch repair protein MutS [Candidatus Sumerlaeia bacterium]|nr:DNA mismatch repair protein MutS [Candidatus Sumerlaeia bacterium]